MSLLVGIDDETAYYLVKFVAQKCDVQDPAAFETECHGLIAAHQTQQLLFKLLTFVDALFATESDAGESSGALFPVRYHAMPVKCRVTAVAPPVRGWTRRNNALISRS